MKVEYDRTTCTAWFQCVQKWEAFEMNMLAGKADLNEADEINEGLFVREVPAAEEDKAKDAAENCPVNAIRILDDDGEQILP